MNTHATYLAMIENIDYNLGRLLKFLKDTNREKDTIIVMVNDNGVTEGLDIYNANMRGSKCTAWEGGTRAFSFWRWKGDMETKNYQTFDRPPRYFPNSLRFNAYTYPLHSQKKSRRIYPASIIRKSKTNQMETGTYSISPCGPMAERICKFPQICHGRRTAR
jgi:hypothetical protein